jgi:hypothetical protein
MQFYGIIGRRCMLVASLADIIAKLLHLGRIICLEFGCMGETLMIVHVQVQVDYAKSGDGSNLSLVLVLIFGILTGLILYEISPYPM